MVATYLLPDDRAAYVTDTTPLDSIRHGGGSQVTIYTDMTCTVLAPIYTYPNKTPIINSLLLVGEDSLLPLFYGDTESVVARPHGGAPYPLYSRLHERIITLENNPVVLGQPLMIGPTQPVNPPEKYAWIQTGMGAGSDWTLWVEDGS